MSKRSNDFIFFALLLAISTLAYRYGKWSMEYAIGACGNNRALGVLYGLALLSIPGWVVFFAFVALLKA